jgi:hypothetical protein
VRLDLGPEDYSPALIRKIVRHGAKDPFEEASVDLREDVGIEITPKQVERITERVGSEWAQARDRDVVAFRERRLTRLYPQAPEVAAIMPDGGRLQTRASGARPGVHDPQWREPKYGCCLTLESKQGRTDPRPDPPEAFVNPERVARLVGEVSSRAAVPATRAPKERKPAPGRRKRRRRRRRRRGRRSWRTPRCLVRTAVATMRPSDRFGEMLAMEAYRRSLDLARRKAYVCDGQAYNWTIWEGHFQPLGFVAILDFVHLLTYVYHAAQAAGGSAKEWWRRYVKWLRWAWGGERSKLLSALTRASQDAGAPPKGAAESDPRRLIASARTYVTNNLDKMDYPRYRKLGLPTSSAPVESEIKQFNRRVKGTEKFWTEEGAEAVLEVRSAYLSQDGRADRNWAMPRPRYRAVGRNRLALVS